MGRTLATLALALLASASGCNSTAKMSPLAFFRGPIEGRSRSTAESNPFRRPGGTDSEQRRAQDALAGAAERESTPPSSIDADFGDHDPATRQLIAEELADATPEERAQLRRELTGLHPEMVREVLRIRRVVSEMRRDAPSQRSELAGREPGILPVALTESPPNDSSAAEARYASGRSDAGLGTIDPWDPGTTAASGAPGMGVTGGGHSFDPIGTTAGPSRTARIQPADLQRTGRATPGVGTNAGAATAYGHSVPLPLEPGEPAGSPNPLLPPPPLPEGPSSPGVASVNVYPPPAPAVDAPPAIGPAPVPALTAAPDAFLPPNALTGATPPAPENLALPQLPPEDWSQELQRLISLTEADIAGLSLSEQASETERRVYVEKHVYLRMLYLMAGQQERALTAIPGIDAADQEFWQQTFWAVANYFDVQAMPDGGDRAAQTVSQLRKAVQRLQETAHLELRNVTFCHKISSFGTYERFERDEFSPGQPVLVYAEVGNFKSEPTVDGQFRTILRSTVEIFKAGRSGDLVERMEFPATEDLCRNYRRDYFHSYEFTMPQKLSLGPHVLKLTVEDQLSRKVATYTLNFTVK